MYFLGSVRYVGTASALRSLSLRMCPRMGSPVCPCMTSLHLSRPSIRTVVFATKGKKVPSFFKLGIEDLDIRRKLKENDVTLPTGCQVKALPHLLAGRHTVVHAPQGSGGTLCYIIALVQRLAADFAKRDKSTSALLGEKAQIERYQGVKHLEHLGPQALVLVPTAHLADQVVSLFNHYVAGGLKACAVHGDSTLQIKANIVLIVAVPTALEKTHLPSVLRRINTVICDNANVMQSGTYNLLKFLDENMVTGGSPVPVHKHPSEKVETDGEGTGDESMSPPRLPTPANRQFIFILSSVPDRYPKFVSWLHSFNDSTSVAGVRLKEDVELSQVLSHQFFNVSTVDEKFERLHEILRSLIRVEAEEIYMKTSNCPTALIIARTDDVDFVGSTLSRNSQSKQRRSQRNKRVLSKEWWINCTGKVHQTFGVIDSNRSFKDFLIGNVKVLVCGWKVLTGCELPPVNAVIFYDFPRHPATYVQLAKFAHPVHGKVFSLVEENNKLVVEVLRKCLPFVGGIAEIKNQQLTEMMIKRRRQTVLKLLLGRWTPSKEALEQSLKLLNYLDSVQEQPKIVPLQVKDDDFLVLDDIDDRSNEREN